MNLREAVQKQVDFMGHTPGGCKLVIHNLLDNGRDVFQFMQLFSKPAIENFYYKYAQDIDELCAEDDEMTPEGISTEASTKLALEKTLILIEGQIKNNS